MGDIDHAARLGARRRGSKLDAARAATRVRSTSTTAVISSDVGEREAPRRGQQLAAGRDQRAAVVDDAARLVAEQVGVDVADAERARALEHEPLPHVELAEGEVARARVQDDVDAAERQLRARALRDPGVLADLEADPDAAAVEQQIADRIAPSAQLDARRAGPAATA